ncbi:hypothetical protein [Rhizobium leguminosarum]|uniref:hypothetical protein n=1 Tax=Rhizobium leguminosarum TaxID=384 RepID=UPI001C910A4C|nr:hypothetical protein [Rhizobium leguminosarum]MBY2916160.1 hypothetical protein [Rhizobium leguminosarum]MBY2971395.1 hypothetical protein [Rhizobium leguminosarum]MBY2978797.1 hypothetical protein [Rhizobium leguminosarum]MBY3007348.1 hypothetical protein [Rhizobium leguminosarum]
MRQTSSLPPIDAWVASSLLQKAIRRGDVEYAEAAALAFHRMRGNAIWRRLILIAFEDIGPSDRDLCIKVTNSGTDISSRSQIGSDGEVITHLVRLMCAAPKNREADYLICSAKQAPFTEGLRAAMARKTVTERIAVSVDAQTPLLQRAVAAWMASGVNGGGPVTLSIGDLPGLMQAVTRVADLEAFPTAAITACEKTSEPIVVMNALLALAIQQQELPTEVVEEKLPEFVLCDGIPSWVFDKHTRLGKSAIRQLLAENQHLRNCIGEFVPEYRALEVAAMAAFYADAVSLKLRMTWSMSNDLYSLGLRTDMTKIGTPDNGVEPIVSTMQSSLEHLNDIRRRLRNASYGRRLSWETGDLEVGK